MNTQTDHLSQWHSNYTSYSAFLFLWRQYTHCGGRDKLCTSLFWIPLPFGQPKSTLFKTWPSGCCIFMWTWMCTQTLVTVHRCWWLHTDAGDCTQMLVSAHRHWWLHTDAGVCTQMLVSAHRCWCLHTDAGDCTQTLVTAHRCCHWRWWLHTDAGDCTWGLYKYHQRVCTEV